MHIYSVLTDIASQSMHVIRVKSTNICDVPILMLQMTFSYAILVLHKHFAHICLSVLVSNTSCVGWELQLNASKYRFMGHSLCRLPYESKAVG